MMNTFEISLDDSEETRVIDYTLQLEVSLENGEISHLQLEVREYIQDWTQSDFQWVDEVTASSAAVAIGISMDELMDECIDVIQKF